MAGPTETLIVRISTRRDPIATARVEETQCLLLVGRDPWLAEALIPLCSALDIDIVTLDSHHDLPIALHRNHPIGIVSGLDAAGLSGCGMLRTVAAYDPDLPVMLVTGEDPDAHGTVDAAERLWGLSQVCRMSEAPGPHEVMNFLFLAGRHAGSGRLMPLA